MQRFILIAPLLVAPALGVALGPPGVPQSKDWVVNFRSDLVASVTATTVPAPGGGSQPGLLLSNGLLQRTFVTSPCFGTVDLALLPPVRTRFLRALSPEASLSINGSLVNVGGCLTDANPEFFDPAANTLTPDPTAAVFTSYEVGPIVAPYAYTPGERHSPADVAWPPKGVHLTLHFNVTSLPDPNSSSFAGPFPNTQLQCGTPTGDCLIGWPTCDNSSVPGQCSWPRDSAVQSCAAWPACAGVQCNPDRPDCQARAAPIILTPSHYNCYYRSNANGAQGLDIAVHYELYDGLPVLKKYVTASSSAGSFVIDDLFVEFLRAPNFAPEQIFVSQIAANNPTPFSQQIVPELTQSFPGRTQQLWFFDPEWDACCDQELHVSYTYYTRLVVGYGPDVTFGGLTGPGALVTPSAPFESIPVRLLFHDTTDWERQGLANRRMQQLLAPQLMESPLYTMVNDISSTAIFESAISEAAQAGLELIVIGYGAQGYCGLCPEQIENATWVSWFSDRVAFATSVGVGVSAYTLMQHNGWGETVPNDEQVLNRDGTRGGIACFATDWHAAYRQSVLDFARAVNLSGIETDGQYESAACADEGGDHHHNGLAGSWHAQMAATSDFNHKLREQGLYQTGADAYFWSGAAKWNHADSDAGYSLSSLWERLSVGRDYVYDSTTTRLHSSGMYGLNDLEGASRQCDPSPGRLLCVDFALASFLGQGVIPDDVSPVLWDPSDPDAAAIRTIFSNWSSFFAAHRPVLTSAASVHIVRPSARAFEASAHLLSDATAPERALLTLYNPSSTAVAGEEIALNLYYAGFAPGTQVTVSQVSPSSAPSAPVKHTVGVDGGVFDIVLPVAMEPATYALFVVAAA